MKNKLLILCRRALPFLILLLSTYQVFGFGNLYSQTVSLSLKNVKLSVAIDEISRQTNLEFAYSKEVVDLNRIVSISANNLDVKSILDQLLQGTDLYHAIMNGKIYIGPKFSGLDQSRQQIRITGTVLDEISSEPLPGVNIVIDGTSMGVVTDINGNYSIEVPSSSSVLVFSYIGYNTEKVSVQNRSVINISMIPDIKTLGEVVVVGYGTQKKEDVIGSISTVKATDMNMPSIPTFESGLQGMAAGVSVQTQSGSPGSPTSIRIRGVNSISSRVDPLWIIDGMPVFDSPYGLGSSGQSPMSLINPNDIESIQILKDAAATAVYGSRASNGVIIVTTKNGKKGEGNTTINVNSGISTLTRTPEDVGYVNTQEWFEIMDEAYKNSGTTFTMNDYYRFSPYAFSKLTRQEAEAINTNWFDEIFRTGTFTETNLSTSRGFEKGNLYLSGNYRKDQGVIKHNDLERISLRSNLDFKPSTNFSIGAKISFGYTNNERRTGGMSSLTINALPWFPVKDLSNPNRYFNAYTGSNPAALNDPDNFKDNVEQFRGLGGINVQYNLPFVEGLSIKSELAGDLIQSNIVTWQNRDIRLDGSGQNPASYAFEEAVTFKSINYNAYASFDRSIKKHSFNVVAGFETTRMEQYSRSMSGEGLTGIYPEIGSPTILRSISGRKNGERYLLGYFGRANYRFKNYLAGISVRNDASSVFTKENRWGSFIAASAGWVLSDEKFMSFLNNNTYLKLRGSYGEVGNQNIVPGLDAQLYSGVVTYGSRDILGVNGTLPTNMAVANLTWESTKSADFGLDFGLFNNRLNGSFAYYHRLVYRMLLTSPVPVSTGIASDNLAFDRSVYDLNTNVVWGNIGDMINKGLELELHATIFDRSNFKWTSDFNISFNKNFIKKLTPEADQTGKGIVTQTQVSRKGHRRFEWFVADYAGVDRITGIPMIYVRDEKLYDSLGVTQRLKAENGKDSLTYATRTNISKHRFYQDGKSADPTYYGGITNAFQYKGFDLSFLISFSGGNYILDYDRQMATVPNETRLMLKDLKYNAWRNPGDEVKYPQLRARGTYIINGTAVSDFGDDWVFHNRELYKGDFIRLRNVQIGYSIPATLRNRLKMQGMRIYVSGTNLFTITDYPGFDPEGAGLVFYSGAIPQLKSFSIGIDARF